MGRYMCDCSVSVDVYTPTDVLSRSSLVAKPLDKEKKGVCVTVV